MIYTTSEKDTDDGNNTTYKVFTHVFDIDSRTTTRVGNNKVTVEAFIGNRMIFTKPSPNELNKDLFVKFLILLRDFDYF